MRTRIDERDRRRPKAGFSRGRRGVAAVEFVVCIPLFVLLTAGAIQVTDAIYLKNSLRVTAHEAARVAMHHDTAQAQQRADEILAARNVQNATVTFTPADVTTAARGEPITVTVTAPASSNTVMPSWYFSDRTIRATMVMVRE